MQLPQLTRTEQAALVVAMANSFGPCTCRSQMACDGHRFLAETQAFGTDRQQIDRVTRLVYTRREVQRWLDSEFGRPFTLQPEPEQAEPLPPDLLGPPVPESPRQGDDSGTLPW